MLAFSLSRISIIALLHLTAASLFFLAFPQKIIGLSDLDMPWSEQAQIYIAHEKDILSGLNYSVIEPLPGLKKANLITRKP